MTTHYLGQSLDLILGEDFLTWLWYMSETAPENAFETADGRPFGVRMEQRICVQGGEGEHRDTTTVSGPLSELREARLGLSIGKKVTRSLIIFEREGEVWRFTLRAEDFAVSGLKPPSSERGASADEEPDALFYEKMYFLETCMDMLDAAYRKFLSVRLSPKWDEEAASVRGWMLQ